MFRGERPGAQLNAATWELLHVACLVLSHPYQDIRQRSAPRLGVTRTMLLMQHRS
jgi:hypothetical protein